MENMLVYSDADTPLDKIVEHAVVTPFGVDVRDVEVIEAARANKDEVWSPQLLPYRPWASAMRDVGSDNNYEESYAAWCAGKDSAVMDSMLLGKAAAAHHKEDKPVDNNILPEGFDASKASRAGDLYSAGALWMGEYDDLLACAAREGMGGSAAVNVDFLNRTTEDMHDAIGVRQEADGYALVAFDLRRFAALAGSDQDLVVVLPSFVGGVPIVRIAAEAFSRRYVQGISVRLLVIPDTVKSIGTNAFLAMSAQCIHIGKSVELLGEQRCDLAGVSPRLARREYLVDSNNPWFVSRDGSLFGSDGKDLLFLAPPYAERVQLPEDVEKISSAAFADGCEPPLLVDCSESLVRADSKAWDEAVWRCPAKTPVHRVLKKRGVRLAGPQAIELDGCWYDFDDEGAVLVAGPPKPVSVSRRFAEQAAVRAVAVRGKGDNTTDAPSPFAAAAEAATEMAASGDAGSTVDYVSASVGDVLSLPRQIEGHPLVRIGMRALPFAPASVVFPDTVRCIERDNACRSTKRLVLPEGLLSIGAHCFWSRKLDDPVLIPASVESVGEGSFEYAICRLEHNGSVVHVSADQLLSCFLTQLQDGVPFDYGSYDDLLRSGKNLPDRLGALIHRLAAPCKLSDDMRDYLVSQLRENEREAQERVARDGDLSVVQALVDAGFIDEGSFDRQIELLRSCNRTDCVAYLMEWRQEHRTSCNSAEQESVSTSDVLRDKFAL